MQKLISLLILVFLSSSLFAQVGEIQGKVKDMEMNGEGLPFTDVYVEVDGVLKNIKTDTNGLYSIKSLPPGVYNVTTEHKGYYTVTIHNIITPPDKSTFINFYMLKFSIDNACTRGRGFEYKGRITDNDGKAIKGAIIFISKNQFTSDVFSEKNGEFKFNLHRFDYNIAIKHPDYETYKGIVNTRNNAEQTFILKKKAKKECSKIKH